MIRSARASIRRTNSFKNVFPHETIKETADSYSLPSRGIRQLGGQDFPKDPLHSRLIELGQGHGGVMMAAGPRSLPSFLESNFGRRVTQD
jgi:hypothetical protein